MPEIQQGQHSNYCPIFLAQCIYLYDPGDSQIYIEGHFFFLGRGKGLRDQIQCQDSYSGPLCNVSTQLCCFQIP